MNYVDIIIIAILAFFALVGMWKGVGKTLIKILCIALALGATWLVATKLVGYILELEFLKDFIVGDKNSLFSLYYKTDAIKTLENGAVPGGVMGYYIEYMVERYVKLGIPLTYGITPGQFVAAHMTINTLTLGISILFYGVARIVTTLIGWILKNLLPDEMGGVSRFFGFIVGAVRGAILVVMLLIVSTALYPFGFMKTYNANINKSIIGDKVAEYTYKAYDFVLYGSNDEPDAEKTDEMLKLVGFTKKA